VKLRVYLDTSVFSAYFDSRVRDRQRETEPFWARRQEFDLATSELGRDELRQPSDPVQRRRLLGLLRGFTVLAVTEEMKQLGQRYVREGVFAATMLNDALHVAAAVISRQDVLLLWNFRHLVNRRRRAKVNDVNVEAGLPTIEILAPSEL
jgi:predicted nucleic acid-binding protein